MWTSKLTGQSYVLEGKIGQLFSFVVDTGEAAFRLTADECREVFGRAPTSMDESVGEVTEMAI